jgi:hypothetical protein
VKADLTIPARICVKFENGGMCEVHEGATLTINGSIDAPIAKIFRGAGTVKFGPGRVERVYPQWWGAESDDDVDDTSAIQAAIDSLAPSGPWTSGDLPPNGGVIFFPSGRYDVSSTLKIYDGTTLEGTPNRSELRATKAVPAIIQRSDTSPPPTGIHFNNATRVIAARIAHLLLNGQGGADKPVDTIDIEGTLKPLFVGSAVGLDLTNVAYTTIDHVTIIHCKTGVLMGQLCVYNNLINTAAAHCETGIESNIGTMNNNIFGGRITAAITGILINNTGQLNIYGITFDAYKKVAIDIRTGDWVNLENPWFDSVAPAIAVKIAPQVSSCSIVNPRFASTTPQVIDNQSGSTLILGAWSDEETLRSDLLQTKSLRTSGISQTNVKARNLRGSVTISDEDSSGFVTFPAPEPDNSYFVTATCVSAHGNPPADARHIFLKTKAETGFEIGLDSAPGGGNSVTVDWILMR